MADELDTLLRIESLMKSILRVSLVEAMNKLLTDDKLHDLYWNTGKLRREDLEKSTGFSAGKISGLWSQWEQAGLLVKSGKSFKRPFE